MKMLRISLVCALGMGTLAAGCGDDDRPPTDAGTPAGDAGPPRDAGPPGDAGPPRDAGPGGTDGGMGGMCPPGDCDLLTNGCPAGQACYMLSAMMGVAPVPTCQPSGTGMTGMTCATYGDCAEGYICVQNPPPATGGKCQHYCCGGSNAGCPTGQTCAVQFTDMSGADLGAGYCKLPDVCDPTAMMTGCGAGEGCYISDDGSGTCIASTHSYTEGMTCMAANDCAPGLACYSVGMGGPTCHQYCNTTMMGSCTTMGAMCNSLGIAALPNLGICITP